MVFASHAVLLLVLAGAICVIGDEQQYAKAFFLETFSPGWEQRWQYTNVKKYKGRFNNIKQEALQDEAIQVGLSWLVLSIAAIEFAKFFVNFSGIKKVLFVALLTVTLPAGSNC